MIADGVVFFYTHQLNFHFFLKDKKKEEKKTNDYCVRPTNIFFVLYIYKSLYVYSNEWIGYKRKRSDEERERERKKKKKNKKRKRDRPAC